LALNPRQCSLWKTFKQFIRRRVFVFTKGDLKVVEKVPRCLILRLVIRSW
jgi:hypothetical protein